MTVWVFRVDTKQVAICLAGLIAIAGFAWSREHFLLFSTIGSNVTLWIEQFISIPEIHFTQVEYASRFFSSEFLSSSATVCAFLAAQVVCYLFLEERESPRFLFLVGLILFSVLVGTLLGPFFAAFPPVAGLLCRVLCPESLSYPKPYMESDKYVEKVTLAEVASLVTVLILALVVVGEFAQTISGFTNKGAYLWLIFGIPLIFILYLWRALRRQGKISLVKFSMSVVYHVSSATFWYTLVLIVLFSYLPVFIFS